METKEKTVTLEVLKTVKDYEDDKISELNGEIAVCLYIDSDGYICLKEA